MNQRREDQELIEEMADVIVALTREVGGCGRMDLVKAGFNTRQIGKYYALAMATASLVLKRNPKNH